MVYNSCHRPASLPEDILITIAKHRDEQLFIQLYDYYAPRLKRYLVNLGAQSANADEILQETLLLVWHKCDSYDPQRATLSTWIYRIARNQWIDHIRKAKPHLLSSYELYPPTTEQALSTDEMESSADKTVINQALQSLPQTQAQLIYKSYYEGQSHREIAQSLNMPLGSVKSGLRLAFKKLRKALRVAP